MMAALISGGDLTRVVKGLVHDKRQVKEHSMDLTVREVYALDGSGYLDFGGSEYKEPIRRKVEPLRRKDGDEYCWWDLEAGTYLVTLNETVDRVDGVGFISPHPRLLKAGCTHPTLFTLEWKKDYVLPLTIGENGLELKENAIISKLMVLKL
jgi:hypothetical protein